MAMPVLLYYPFAFMLFVAVVSYEHSSASAAGARALASAASARSSTRPYQLTGLLAPDGRVSRRTGRRRLRQARRRDVVGRTLWRRRGARPTGGAAPAAGRRSGAPRWSVVRFEAPLGDASIDLSLQPIRDQGGAVIMLLPEGSDVTERRAAEARLVGPGESGPARRWRRSASSRASATRLQQPPHRRRRQSRGLLLR